MPDATTIDDLKRFVAEAPLNGESLRFRLLAVPQGLNVAQGQLPQNLLPVRRLLAPDFTFDAYCPPCGQHSIFNAIFNAAEVDAFVQNALNGGRFYRILRFGCTRVDGHEIAVALRMWSVSVPNAVNPHDLPVNVDKIGMSPSLADLQEPLNRNAAKVLGEQGRREFNRAVGLFAHDIGIGAFVYLRRIFENLINEAASEAIKQGQIKAEDFYASRMDEKIVMLRADLPQFLVDNREWYGIVSKGIHELTEEECKEYFPVVRNGIEIILAQKAETLERRARERETAAAIDRINEKIARTIEPTKET